MTKKNDRRAFIQQSSMAMAALALPSALFAFGKPQTYNLSFSTLGCPNWSLSTIVQFATQNNYKGVEIRVVNGEMDLPKCPDFSAANIAASKRMFADNNLKITDLGCSANMHFADAVNRKKNLDDAKRYTDLAEKLSAPYIRVFPNSLPTDETRKATLDLIAAGLNELAEYAKNSHVTILMETHGDLVKADEVIYVMKQTTAKNIGLVWDFFNMWSITKEPPTEVYAKLKKYIRHVHVKDAKMVDGKEQYVLLGRGEAPVREAVSLLKNDHFKGFYSFEWEKVWHPEIAEPEIALADYPKAIAAYFLDK